MRRDRLVTPQPLPLPGKFEVKGLVGKHLTANSPHLLEVASDCIYKMEASEEKYGSPLMTHNGRSADLDAYQDLLDTINYAVQAYYEEGDSFLKAEMDEEIEHLTFVAMKIRFRLITNKVL